MRLIRSNPQMGGVRGAESPPNILCIPMLYNQPNEVGIADCIHHTEIQTLKKAPPITRQRDRRFLPIFSITKNTPTTVEDSQHKYILDIFVRIDSNTIIN